MCCPPTGRWRTTRPGGDAWRGTGGPLFISANRRDLHPLVKDYIAACEAAGLPFTPDFNGAEQEGTGSYQLTVKGGRRNSAARAFLRPAMKRANVQVMTDAHGDARGDRGRPRRRGGDRPGRAARGDPGAGAR